MRGRWIGLLLLGGALSVAGVPAGAVTLRVTVGGSVVDVYGNVPAETGLELDAPVFLELTYDSEAADDYSVGPFYSSAFYLGTNPAFSLAVMVGTTVYAQPGAIEAQVYVAESLGVEDSFNFQRIDATGEGPIVQLTLTDEAAPFELVDGLSIHQVPNPAAFTSSFGTIEDNFGAWGGLFFAESVTIEVVPEPATSFLVGGGLAALAASRRRAPARTESGPTGPRASRRP